MCVCVSLLLRLLLAVSTFKQRMVVVDGGGGSMTAMTMPCPPLMCCGFGFSLLDTPQHAQRPFFLLWFVFACACLLAVV